MAVDYLKRLLNGGPLTRSEAAELLKCMTAGKLSPAQAAAILTIYQIRDITVEELRGFRDAMISQALRVELIDSNCCDLCGTGGDGKNTFNISTAASFVVAAAGIPVTKHGNYSSSSLCGSSNVLEKLGVSFTSDREQLQRQLERSNFCYLHAPLFHPAMKNVAAVRKSLGIRTIFNLLGPLSNPASPPVQLTGVSDLKTARLYTRFFLEEKKAFSVVHSLDGYDEISLTGEFAIFSEDSERINSPADLGINTVDPSELVISGGSDNAAKLFMSVLKGEGSTAQHDVVAINAAAALKCIRSNQSLSDLFHECREIIVSGKAFNAFNKYLEAAQK